MDQTTTTTATTIATSSPSSSSSGVVLPRTLEDARITFLPRAAYYIPDFLSEAEEALILAKVSAAPKPRWKHLAHRRLQTWPSELARDALLEAPLPEWLEEPVVARLLSLRLSDDGVDGIEDDNDGDGDGDSQGGKESGIFAGSPHGRPNHVLVNEYPPGVGIMPHKDGAAYHPIVCTISLNTPLCLSLFRTKPSGALDPVPAWRILQEPRSLLITTGELYTSYLHGIDEVVEDVGLGPETVANWGLLREESRREVGLAGGRCERGVRTSLTYRDVRRVVKFGGRLGMMLGRK